MSKAMSRNVGAIDVGFTNVKWKSASARGHFPSVVTTAPARAISSSLGARRNTVTVQIGNVAYEVGPDARMALAGNASGQINDILWFTSDQYKALVYGALHEMQAPEKMELLVLGLPVSTYSDAHCAQLAEVFKGDHTIAGRNVSIEKVLVLPQPYGGFASMVQGNEKLLDEIEEPDSLALVIDPGWNTVDWFAVQGGRIPLDGRTNAAENAGMVRILSAVADEISRDKQQDVGSLYRLDEAIRLKRPLKLCGRDYPIGDQLIRVGMAAAEESVQRVLRGVGTINDVTHVFLVGGAAAWFKDAVKAAFSGYNITVSEDPLDSLYANVSGYYWIGEQRIAEL